MASDNSITLTDHMLHQITENQMISLDIEGAIKNITQISIINGNGDILYNQMTPFLPFPKGHSEKQHQIIQNLLDQAVFIVGFGINNDLKILNEAGFFISSTARCIDIAATFDWMKRMRLIEKKKLTSSTLKGVAEYFGIHAVQGYHMSHVDATITLEIFKKIYDINKGFFCTVKPKISIKEGQMIQLPSSSLLLTKAEMTSHIYKINSNLYEGLLIIEGTKIVVRLTADEYKLYQRICRYEPCYTLEIFFNTIMNPAEVRKVEAMIEADREKELAALKEQEATQKAEVQEKKEVLSEGAEKDRDVNASLMSSAEISTDELKANMETALLPVQNTMDTISPMSNETIKKCVKEETKASPDLQEEISSNKVVSDGTVDAQEIQEEQSKPLADEIEKKEMGNQVVEDLFGGYVQTSLISENNKPKEVSRKTLI